MPIQRTLIVPVLVSDQDTARSLYSDMAGIEMGRASSMGNGSRWVCSPGAETSLTRVPWLVDRPRAAWRARHSSGDHPADHLRFVE